ncbi:MAG: DUF3631 domain-containing protein [Gammaproteobacteria bacterium]
MSETPQQAARRFSAKAIQDGFVPEGLYPYRDADGNIVYHRIRCKRASDGAKWIRPMRSNGHGYELREPEFPNGKPLYRLPDIAARPEDPVWFVEGETCADALAKLGVLATTSGPADSAKHADFSPLAKRNVIIWPDNDEAGLRHAREVADRLIELGATVRLVDIAKLNLPDKGDVVDWLEAHPKATAADLDALPMVDAPTADDAPTAYTAETIARLAGLAPIEYDRVRQSEAERLGVRVGTLDTEVARQRPQSETGTEAGAAVLFDEPEPWPEPVDGAALLDALAETFARYLVLPPGAADALALWTAHTHVFDAFECTPRLNVTAPQKQCGKTLVLDVLQPIIAKGLRTESVSTAVLFRLVDKEMPSLLIDECDSFLRDNEELRGALNAGHRRGGRHLRCEGDKNEVRAFKTFAPVVLAGIGTLPGTLADRSIIIRMQRAMPGEVRERFDSRKTAALQAIKRKLARFAQDSRARLEAADPDTPGLYNRRADNWRPLFAIAEVAGADWPQKVKKAVTALADKSDENESAGVLLLADICQLFRDTGRDKLASSYIVDRLIEMEERPWPEFRRGKAITKRQIASLLRPFGIISGTRREAGNVFRGYELRQFAGAFSRYLGADTADQSVTPLQAAMQSDSEENLSVTNSLDVTLEGSPKPAPHKACNAVTDRNAGCGARVWTAPTWEVVSHAPKQRWSMRI